jgi:hypothetical protein
LVVIFPGVMAWLAMLFGFGGAQDSGAQPVVRRVVVGSEIILRVPVQPLPPPRFEWVEHKGPKCIDWADIRGAMLSGPANVDFLLPDRQRVRAEFAEDCAALDFYGGFYLSPRDEQVCVRRDSVHSRMGGSCRIERFRKLVPKLRG